MLILHSNQNMLCKAIGGASFMTSLNQQQLKYETFHVVPQIIAWTNDSFGGEFSPNFSLNFRFYIYKGVFIDKMAQIQQISRKNPHPQFFMIIPGG